jgi:hypothetical protein
MIEKDPVSFALRRIVLDPATIKLLTFIFSLVLIISTSSNVRWQDWNLVPLIVIFGGSLLYSAFSLAVVVFKKQESVTNCEIFKKTFRGRPIFWHEIQTTCAITFAVANISGIVLSGSTREPFIQVLFSSLNIFCFTLEWYFAAENGKTFVTEENPKMGHNCLDCIYAGFHTFPLFFNVIRKGCLIAALVLVVANSAFGYSSFYFIYCTAFAIAGSFMLFVLQTSGTLENGISTKLISGRKWHTYIMLIVVIHAFLAVLTFSIIVDYRNIDRTGQDSQRVYYNSNYNNYYNYNGGYTRRYRTYYGYTTRRYRTYNDYNMITSTQRPTYGTTWYTWHYTDRERFNAPIESPISFVLSCIAFILSAIDLYVRAIYSRSRRDNEITAPLHIQGGINKIEDLPITIASPHSFDNPNKQFYI